MESRTYYYTVKGDKWIVAIRMSSAGESYSILRSRERTRRILFRVMRSLQDGLGGNIASSGG